MKVTFVLVDRARWSVDWKSLKSARSGLPRSSWAGGGWAVIKGFSAWQDKGLDKTKMVKKYNACVPGVVDPV